MPAPHPYHNPETRRELDPRFTEAGQILSRMMLDNVHAKVRKAFPQVAKSVWRAATVHSMASLGEYQVSIKVPRIEPFQWEGHAVNEYHARMEAWCGFLREHPGDC